jgi:hemerythrin-like metal-binding protein
MPDPVVDTMFQWSNAYAVGVRQIDEEHRRLFALADSLHQAMLEGQGKAVLRDILADLVAYTCYHFTHEEQLMRRIRYPDYQPHRAQHVELRSKVQAMQDRAASGEITMTIEVMQFLVEWLKTHIPTSDCRVALYIKQSRCSPIP